MTVRTFKVMEHGDRGLRKGAGGSELRFRGQWLAEAGFAPGTRVRVVVRKGHLEIALDEPVQLRSEDFQAAVAGLDKALGVDRPMRWCAPCKSYHVDPADEAAWKALQCFRSWPEWVGIIKSQQ